MSSRSSTRKKEEPTHKSKKKDVSSKASDDSEEDNDSKEETEVVSLSDGEESSDDVKAPKKRGSCTYNKSAFSMPDDISKLMNRVLCTSCGKQLNPMNEGAIRKHPWLKVVTCKKCYKFLKSGPFTRDNEGTDEQCRWCGDGGRLYGCDYCHNCFCRSCIKRNLGRSEAAEMESESPKSKWKCYMCKPKKIITLYDNCKKILDYIKKEEEKEQKREERAKQREKDKAQAAKEKKAAAQSEKAGEKNDRRSSLPAPKLKVNLETNKGPTKTSMPAPQSKDCILIEDSPDKIAFKHATAKSHLSSYNSRPGDGVRHVNKIGNGLTQVVVGPKAKMAITTPYKENIAISKPPINIQPRPNLYGALTSQLQSSTSLQNPVGTNKKSIATLAKLNNIRAIKEQIVPFNVETHTERLSSVAQQLSLTMNSVKTDLAIAKLSSVNIYNSRTQAAFSVKTGLDAFFNNIRDIFNVQIVTNPAEGNAADVAIKIDDDTDVMEESLPNGKQTSDGDKKPSNIKEDKMDIKETIEKLKTNSEEHTVMETDGDNDRQNNEEGSEYVDNKKESKELKDTELSAEKENGNENKDTKDIEKKIHKQNNSESKDKSDKEVDSKGAKSNISKVDEMVSSDEDIDNEKTAVELDFLQELADEIKDSDGNGESSDDSIETHRSTRRGKSQPLKNNDDVSDNITETDTLTRKSSRNKSSNKDQSEKSKDGEDKKKSSKGKTSEITEKTSKSKSKDIDEKDNKKEKTSGQRNDDEAKRTSPTGKVSETTEKASKSRSKDIDDKDSKKEKNSDKSKDGEDKKKSSKGKTSETTEKTLKSKSKDIDEKDNKKEKTSGQRNDDEAKRTSAKGKTSEITEKASKSRIKDIDDKDPKKEIKPKVDAKRESKSRDDDEKNSKTEQSKTRGKKRNSSKEDESSTEENDESPALEGGDESPAPEGEDESLALEVEEESAEPEGEEETAEPEGEEESAEPEGEEESPEPEDEDESQAPDGEDESPEPEGEDESQAPEDKDESPEREGEDEEMNTEESEKGLSSDSDSNESTAEFGKRKKKRKVKEKAELQDGSKTIGKSKEQTKGKAKAKTDTTKSVNKKEKSSIKKEGNKKKVIIESAEEEGNHSDSSNYDSDLEKDIKSLSKDTKLQRRTSRATAAQKVAEKKTNNKKPAKSSKNGKDKSSTEEYDDLSSNSDEKSDEDDEDNDKADDEQEDEDNVDEDNLTPAQIRKLRAAQKAKKEESDYEDMAESGSSDSEDPEVSFPNLETPKKGKKKGKEEESEDSDFTTPKKKRQRLKIKLLDANLSGSDSDVGGKKKKKGRGKKRKKDEEDEEPDPEDEVYSDDGKKRKGKGKRKRIRKVSDSSEEEKEKKEKKEEEDTGEYEDDDDDNEDTPGHSKRRKIRKVMANKKLADSTKEARKAEEERRKRIDERQKEFNAYVELEGGQSEDEVPEGTERETKDEDETSIAKILGTAKKVPVTSKCVLDMDKDKKILVEINQTLVRKLKPHQVEAARFMYNCCVESVERLKKEEGAGCILAHCMGLGKTLSVITFLHTMLSNVKLTKMTKCLVVCPLNTVLNWVNEFEIWLDDVDYEIDVYEMSRVKQNYERAQMLKEWHEGKAGVMILGYDMYRNLVMGNHCKNKKQKATFYETLADPGPDIVICDEGHILKNDATSLSKSMNKIKTRRRVVLTGTPLQNNLGEYHCMVNFVKPNLLGTRKEFSNRFVNPITNGQCTDSVGTDVKLMKRRAHILHEMLAGCVQRKDYSALTKFLPPKFEYVISVRMGKLQCQLYERYLTEAGVVQNEEIQGKGGRLFRDYQALMRIWTHPWVLKLDEIRQENKRTYDSEDSFIDETDEDDDEDSFLSKSTTSESDSDFVTKKKSKGKKKTRSKRNNSSSDSDVKEVNEENEVVKKWTSKRRGNEEGAGSSWMQDMGYSTGPKEVSNEWWAEFVKEEDEFKTELSGKLTLVFEILKMCEDIGDKVLVFSQSLLSLDIIEDFLHHIDESSKEGTEGDAEKKTEGDAEKKTGEGEEKKTGEGEEKKTEEGEEKKTGEGEEKKTDGEGEKKEDTTINGDEKESGDDKKEGTKKEDKYAGYGKSWTIGADYFRMDGSTNSQQRKASQDSFNDPENYRARLFLISTKAGSLGINLVAANRVIIFDASWNPSHDIQSIFRVYRFGQVKPVYVYRFLAQGTMEEKIYERQIIKQSLSQRVVDEHQIERHFNSNDLQELYKFQPDRLDDPDRKEQPLPMLPKDHMLAELMGTQKDWLVTFHEHDSLLENIVEQELSEEEKKAAWEDYENDKKGLNTAYPGMYGNMITAQQRMNSAMEFQNLVLQGQANLGQEVVLQIVQDLKTRFPTLPPEVFSQRVQAVLRQVLTQRIMQQTDFQRRQLDQQKMAELNRLNQIKQQIQQQQAMINTQQRGLGLGNYSPSSLYGVQALPSSGYFSNVVNQRTSGAGGSSASASSSNQQSSQKSNSKGDKK